MRVFSPPSSAKVPTLPPLKKKGHNATRRTPASKNGGLWIPILFIWRGLKTFSAYIDRAIPRDTVLKLIGLASFIAIVINFVPIFGESRAAVESKKRTIYEVYPSRRGNIFIKNSLAGRDISVTSSELVSTIMVDAHYLKINIDKGYIKKDAALTALAAELNLSWNDLNRQLSAEIAKPKPGLSVIVQKYATAEQGAAVQKLRDGDSALHFENWLAFEPFESRQYTTLGGGSASLIGYAQRDKLIRADVLTGNRDCVPLVTNNEKRGTVDSYDGTNENGVYKVGVYGIEGNFCAELGGLNGRQARASEIRNANVAGTKTQNGADIYLTIDANIQLKAEEILKNAIETNVSKLTGNPPKNGSIMVISLEKTEQTEAGAILAMASYPFANSNKYELDESGGFINAGVRSYEAGSVLKPLTVAAGLNEWFLGTANAAGERVGLDPNWNWTAYPSRGKPFEDGTGVTKYVSNALGATYSNEDKSLRECLRRSINTCLTDIEQRISNSVQDIASKKELDHSGLISYFRDKFMISKPTVIRFNTDGPPRTDAFDTESGIDISAASWSFGQGFTVSPLQLMRAYTAIARSDGTLLEPYIVDKAVYETGKIDAASDPASPPNINHGVPTKTLDPRTVQTLQEWMVYTLDKYGEAAAQSGQPRAVNGYVEGYPIAAKTGTAQVTRPEATKGLCQPGEEPLSCSLRVGIYDQTFIGFGPVGEAYKAKPRFLVLLKLAEPRVGEPNYFGINGLGQYFSQMFDYTLSYYNVPKTPGR
jgi:cell division protein FtsI/penicillin-binding protein 2